VLSSTRWFGDWDHWKDGGFDHGLHGSEDCHKEAQKIVRFAGANVPRAYRRIANFACHRVFVTFCGHKMPWLAVQRCALKVERCVFAAAAAGARPESAA
jgi:hypothetical protein